MEPKEAHKSAETGAQGVDLGGFGGIPCSSSSGCFVGVGVSTWSFSPAGRECLDYIGLCIDTSLLKIVIHINIFID